jgi:hypothetical protein
MFLFAFCTTISLIPPSLVAGAKVGFDPRGKEDFAIVARVDVGERQGQRSWSTDHRTIGRILGTMTGAHEFVIGRTPRHDATQVCAHGVEAKTGQRLVFLDDQVPGMVYLSILIILGRSLRLEES